VDTRAVMVDAFERVREDVGLVLDGLTPDDLAFRAAPDANSIAWLVWHLTRIEDDHVAHLAGRDQVWTADEWIQRFALPFDAGATGYGHTSDDVAAVRVDDPALLIGYHDAVHATVLDYVRRVDAAELDRIVDTRWDPPVTAGVRLVSVVNDATQHIGQAAYVRGLLGR
jgi:uncharacterized protein DUF664